VRFGFKTSPQDTSWDAVLAAAAAAAFGAAGAGLAIVYLPPPHTPAVLEPLASALSELS
jgi:hypothetical protein